MFNLAAFEFPSRRCQAWESAYKYLLREVDGGPAGGDDWLNERFPLFGVKNLRSSATGAPEPEDFATKERGARPAVPKGRRKAREEAVPAKGLEPQVAPTAIAKTGAQN